MATIHRNASRDQPPAALWVAFVVALALHALAWWAWRQAHPVAVSQRRAPPVLRVAVLAPAPGPRAARAAPAPRHLASKRRSLQRRHLRRPAHPARDAQTNLPQAPARTRPATRVDSRPAATAGRGAPSMTPPASAAAPPAPPSSAATAARAPGPRHAAAYLDTPRPRYPRAARRFGEQGRVLLRVEVGTDGRVRDVRLQTSSGYSDLDDAALRAVRGWTFVAARESGRAVAAWVTVPVDFRLGR